MRPKSLILLLLALGCGLVASIGINQVLAKRDGGANLGEMEKIYVASNGIGMREGLTAENVSLEEWPKSKVPPGALRKAEQIEGRTTKTRIYAGEPILNDKLHAEGESGFGVTDFIPAGFRVVPVKVNDVSGGAKLVLPGDRVDVQVYVRRNQALGVHQTLTLTVLQNAKVFAVNDVVDPNQTGDPESSIPAKTISLVVEKEKAKRLVLASELGNIRLTLRSPDDEIEEVNNSLTIEDLLSGRSFTAEPDNDKASGDGLLSLLNAQPANPVPPVDLTPTNEHVMVVIEGADAIREFRFTDGRAVPVESVSQPNLRSLDATAPVDPPADVTPETPDDDDAGLTDDLDLGFDLGGVET